MIPQYPSAIPSMPAMWLWAFSLPQPTVQHTAAVVVTTDTDSVWALGDRDTTPTTPTGGFTTEEHIPTGWTRTELSATATQAVYRSQRTRTFGDGTFTGATAWGTPVRTGDRLLGLGDIAVPGGRVLVGGTQGSLIEAGTTVEVIYNSSATILAGDDPLSLGDLTLGVSLIRITGSDEFRINRTGTGDVLALYGSGGVYENRQIHVQAGIDADTVLTYGSGDINTGSSAPTRLWYINTADQLTTLESIGVGDRWLFFITSVPESYAVDAGDVAWAFALPQPQVTHTLATLSYNVDAGDVAWAFSYSYTTTYSYTHFRFRIRTPLQSPYR